MREELERIRDWADAKIQGGSEPPWAWYQYMKLIETIDAIVVGMDATVTMESSQQSASQPDVHLRLVDSTCQQDSARPRHVGLPVQMPM
jgi:hypothetical protein